MRKRGSLLNRFNLPLTLTRKGHYRVIDWPNFNIVVSQAIGRPEDREREMGTAGQGSSQNTAEKERRTLSKEILLQSLPNLGRSSISFSALSCSRQIICFHKHEK